MFGCKKPPLRVKKEKREKKYYRLNKVTLPKTYNIEGEQGHGKGGRVEKSPHYHETCKKIDDIETITIS